MFARMTTKRLVIEVTAGADAPEIQPATGTELSDLLATVLAGGQVTVSEPSAELHVVSESDVADGVRIGGVSAFVDEVTAESTQALVY